MMGDVKKISPPAPRVLPDRIVEVPPTVRGFDTNEARPPKDKTRADFRSIEFIRLLEQHGKFVIWRKAILCPDVNETTGQCDMNCALCDGSGFIYIDPIDIRAQVFQFDKNSRIFEKFGMWVEGQAQITVEPKYRLGYRDSIELKDALMPFNELIKKGNRRGRRSKLPDGVDSARYRIASVVRVVYDASDSLVMLEENYHFKIDKNGWIEWTVQGNALVPDGEYVSVRYDFHPVYIVISHPHVLRDDVTSRSPDGVGVPKDTYRALPVAAGAKLDFLVDINVPAPVTGC